MTPRSDRFRLCATTAVLLLGVLALSGCGESSPPPATAASDDPVATLLALPMERLIAYDAEIELTPDQEEIKRAALTPIPAPCCSDRSAYTCCCQCNLGRAWWGLSKVLITEHGQSATEVQANVERWIRNVRPQGFAGDSCYTGRCSTAARHDGCSGMNPNRIVS
ncbi:MAG: hypothetical protein F4112_08515 [Holophagales bacterium]|nr:hypothetical protein [Holophagales bacterium]MYD22409.1 hypothetical protein [Holophagales bacterium]MYI32996.1 hypothetical protein [Holophagales bacterium]